MNRNGNKILYTIQPGDTLWELAERYNTSVERIMMDNPGMDPEYLRVGQIIRIYPNTTNRYRSQDLDIMMSNSQREIPTPSIRRPRSQMSTPGELSRRPMTGMEQQVPNTITPMKGIEPPEEMPRNMMPEMQQSRQNARRPMPNRRDAMENTKVKNDNKKCDLSKLILRLWLEHIFMTRIVIHAIIFDLPNRSNLTEQLLENPKKFETALKPFYGPEKARTFKDKLTEHLVVAADLVQAVKDGDKDKAQELNKKWYENAEDIASFLASINPYWSEDNWKRMFFTHLDTTIAQTTSLLEKNYQKEVTDFNENERHIIEMAAVMSEGIIKQFIK